MANRKTASKECEAVSTCQSIGKYSNATMYNNNGANYMTMTGFLPTVNNLTAICTFTHDASLPGFDHPNGFKVFYSFPENYTKALYGSSMTYPWFRLRANPQLTHRETIDRPQSAFV